MSIRNRFYNWRYGIKRYKGKGCKNTGVRGQYIVKYDWSKPMKYTTKNYYL